MSIGAFMAEEKAEKPKRDLSKLLSLGFMVLNLAIMAGGSFLVYTSTIGVEKTATSEAELTKELEAFKKMLASDQDVMYSMDTMTTNLNGVPRRTVRVDLSLEMMDAEGFEEIMGISAEARDRIMRILNDKNFNEIETVQGKLQLKNEIIAGVNTFLDKGVVKNVFFTDLVVQ